MRFALVMAIALAGCYRPALEQACEITCPSGSCPGDLECRGGICVEPDGTCGSGDLEDGGISTTDGEGFCYGLGQAPFTRICFATEPTNDLVLEGGVIDTDAGCHAMAPQLAQPSPMLCVLLGRNIRVTGDLAVHGSMPLALVAAGELHVEAGVRLTSIGDLDNSFVPAAMRTCGGDGMPSANGGGGGAGGAFQFAGGAGGTGGGNVAGGSAYEVISTATHVTGGCSGGRGGKGGGNPTLGGEGGGALLLIAGSKIVIAGVINVSGSGGKGGDNGNAQTVGDGGGGGGSGGMIALDAPMIGLGTTAQLIALGGSGGGGGDDGDGRDGATAMTATDPLSGGAGAADRGGAGGAASSGAGAAAGMPGIGGGTEGGGGGGGGSAGHIVASSMVIIDSGGLAAPSPFMGGSTN